MTIEFQKQFTGARTQGGDCGMVAVIHALHFATDNEVSPTTTELREKANIPDRKNSEGKVTYATTPTEDWPGAWKAMQSRAKKLGWALMPIGVLQNAPWSSFLIALDNGRGILLAVNYKTYNDLLPKKSGDVDFDGMHAIFVSPETRNLDGKNLLRVYDGLCDGRTDWPSGVKAPKGPQWVDADKLRKCAEAYTSGSGVTFCSVAKAKRIAVEPPVDVHAECKKQLTDCTVERKKLTDRVVEQRVIMNDFQAKIATLEKHNAQLTKNVTDLANGRDKAVLSLGLADEALRNAKAELNAALEALK